LLLNYSPNNDSGDIDQNSQVDSTDVALFTAHLGLANGSVWETGDFDGDGATTLADLNLLQANISQSVGPSPATSAVPEPATWQLL
jgi:hypothetical protein